MSRRNTAQHAAMIAAGLLLASGTVLLRARPRQGGQAAGDQAACAVRETYRSRLALPNGLDVYVEPVALVPSGGRVLLAGTPNYLTARAPDGSYRPVARDSIMGVVIEPGGHPRTIAAPIRGRLISGVRALPRPDGGWDVVFAELKDWRRFPPPDTALRLWHGVYDGRAWTSMNQIPLPPRAVAHPLNSSLLLRSGERLGWAMPVSYAGPRQNVLVFERDSGTWRYGVVPTGRVDQVALVHSDSNSVRLAVVQPDRTLGQDAGSLMLYGRQPAWRRLRRVIRGGPEPLRGLAYQASPEGRAFGWVSFSTHLGGTTQWARSLVGGLDGPQSRVVPLQADVMKLTSVTMQGGYHLWLANVVPDSGRRELAFLRESGTSSTTLGRMPDPFDGGIAAAAMGPTDILLTGPFDDPVGKSGLVSLLVRVRLECWPRPE